MLNMQDALLRLIEYWTRQGCVLMQPVNTEVGAGTLNPATFLRVLGPEPWRTVYVEPSVRPDDSRYGENPNRMQTHTQLQVVLKPEPGNPQEQYLGSLEAIGVDVRRHDVRFVEDNWESPALGAWGLGWEVWLDGLEITQFTYFQQAGGLQLDPVSVELTYGMERIVMALQGVRHFKDIEYAPGITWGEIVGQAEYELSRYYLDEADVDTHHRLFDAYSAEAERLIALRLPLPAHACVLKCSHVFNVLDARGAIGTTQRARAFGRMRRLAHEVAALWAARRAELEYPLGRTGAPLAPQVPDAGSPADLGDHAALLVEIGTEELPAADVTAALRQLEAGLPALLQRARLHHGAVRAAGTPRRLVLTVEDVATHQPELREAVRGPRSEAAFDGEGRATAAAAGFARSRGVPLEALRRETIDGREYVVADSILPGRDAVQVLGDLIPELVANVSFPRTMRWSAPGAGFSRPLRWLVALLGEQVVPCTVAGVASGRTTRLLRTAEPPLLEVAGAQGYAELLRTHGITVSGHERCAHLLDDAEVLAASVGGRVDAEADSDTVEEVGNLIEHPRVLLGAFAEEYLELPAEVLVTVMKQHQRYLPVRDAGGSLLPHFVVVANGEVDGELARAGHEAVLRARYADAAFFWHHDLAMPLEVMREGLTRLVFTDTLGSMRDRADRIGTLAVQLAGHLGCDAGTVEALTSAGPRVKADYASQVVIEFPSLCGVMGRLYALHDGEPAQVAEALLDIELPRGAGDRGPATLPGALLSMADRLDALTGLFAAGMAPRGSNDPFAQRRAALGLLQVILERRLPLDLGTAVDLAAALQPVQLTAAARGELLTFVERRLEQWLLETGHRIDLVRAAMVRSRHPTALVQALNELEELVGSEPFAAVAEAYRRTARMVGAAQVADDPDPERFTEDAERRLWAAVMAAHTQGGDSGVEVVATTPSVRTFVEHFAPLVEPITAYFEAVMVMDENPGLRANRLAQLSAVLRLGRDTVDWSELRDPGAVHSR